MIPERMRSTWETYGRAWSPVSSAERKQLLQDSLSPDFAYLDPRIACNGRAEVTANLEAFQQRQPGGSFVVRDILAHNDVAMVNWQLIKADGTAATLGYDIVRFADSGLMASITAFFARPTA